MQWHWPILATMMVGLLSVPARADDSGARDIAREIIAELNFARTNPSAYAQRLRSYRELYHGRIVRRPGENENLMTKEGVAAVDEAIAFLARQPPLPPLVADKALARAARDHVRDQGPGGMTGHIGSDGSTPSDRVRRYGLWRHALAEDLAYGPATAVDVVRELIIDDGVRDRGHRKAIFLAVLRVAGVACGFHTAYGTMCAIDFADDMDPLQSR
jgi:uncharacterized protein YkwD